jgi:hypothetical protein
MSRYQARFRLPWQGDSSAIPDSAKRGELIFFGNTGTSQYPAPNRGIYEYTKRLEESFWSMTSVDLTITFTESPFFNSSPACRSRAGA